MVSPAPRGRIPGRPGAPLSSSATQSPALWESNFEVKLSPRVHYSYPLNVATRTSAPCSIMAAKNLKISRSRPSCRRQNISNPFSHTPHSPRPEKRFVFSTVASIHFVGRLKDRAYPISHYFLLPSNMGILFNSAFSPHFDNSSWDFPWVSVSGLK